tara:strand:- start:7393 stop:7518 length:126 start_codon:yes stop_codon:yes gene_type:complete
MKETFIKHLKTLLKLDAYLDLIDDKSYHKLTELQEKLEEEE